MLALPSQSKRRVFHGSFVHSLSKRQLEYLQDTALGIDEHGVIAFVEQASSRKELESVINRYQWQDVEVYRLDRGDFIIPGFVDTHTHAPQYPNMGRGQQYQLLDWLSNLTFPTEAKFRDVRYAQRTYESVVKRVIDSGTTTCCWYGTLHLDATEILADIVHKKGQRAFVGKCNMDRNSPPSYVEKTASASIADTKEFISYVRRECCTPLNTSPVQVSNSTSEGTPLFPTSSTNGPTPAKSGMRGSFSNSPRKRTSISSDCSNSSASSSTSSLSAIREKVEVTALVQPIITPRFAISCTDALMAGLQAIVAKDPTLHIQTHLAENPAEIEFTKQLFPFTDSYTHVYDHFGLLTDKTVLAHCVHLEDHEMQLIKQRGAGISHCPTSNLNLRSGNSPVAELLDKGIKVGLGTDVSGGFGHGILTAIREASVVSKVLSFSLPATKEADKQRGRSETPKGGLPVIEPTAGSETKTTPDDVAEPFLGKHLPLETLFYLATLGGAEVCAIQHRIGNFSVGKEFDALLIKTGQAAPDAEDVFEKQRNPALFIEPEDTLEALFEKFLFAGDYNNIASVFVRGRTIGGSEPLL